MDIDHVVLWVESPHRALTFYVDVLGLEALRVEDYEAGQAPFPSVRVNQGTIIDLMDRNALLSRVQGFTGSGEDVGGHPLNHLCLSMTAAEYESLSRNLTARGVEIRDGGDRAFGARGQAVKSVYFDDPDGNVLEIRYYGS